MSLIPRVATAVAILVLSLGAPATANRALAGELDDLRELERLIMEVAEKASKAFVFFEGGSGFVISKEGLVLTNAHVVADRLNARHRDFRVRLAGGRPLDADLIGFDPEGDIALLKLRQEPGIEPLELGDSDALRVGEHVIALGDPFLLGSEGAYFGPPPAQYEPSLSAGIVSALHRYSDLYHDAVQVDVAVNRGNSGGPLITLEGKVVGINGKIETRFENAINSGVGYAIPSNQIRRFLGPLERARGGRVRHGLIQGLGVASRADGERGLAIRQVVPGSLAESSGFQKDDLILSINGLPARSRSRYFGILGTYPAGEVLTFQIARGAEELSLQVTLLEGGNAPFLGIKAESLPDGKAGAIVTEVVPGSPAERAGLQDKDVITSFNQKAVKASGDIEESVKALSVGDLIPISVLREGAEVTVQIRIGGVPSP